MNKYFRSAEKRELYGAPHYIFDFNGHEAHFIVPENARDGAWIWRAEFLDCGFDWVDREMIRRGYALVYYSVSDMYGSPRAVELMHEFYKLATEELGFGKKTCIFGFSRGGLYAANFALRYPEAVSSLYLDAPVLDIKSWPGGLGIGVGAEHCFEECLTEYGLDRSTVLSFKENPTDRADELAALGIPVVMVVGDSDVDVPHTENSEILAAAYEKAGAPLLYVIKPGCDHHPHSLEDPTEICDFIDRYM